MKLFRTLGLATTTTFFALGATLYACSDDDSSVGAGGQDAGVDATSSDGGGHVDGGGTDSGGQDSGGQDSGGQDTGGGEGGALSCAAYCATIATNCSAANAAYPDMTTCMNMCANFPVGSAADMMGDTLGCRTYHAGAAAQDPVLHCPHAGAFGGEVCGARCANFCDLAFDQCNTDAGVAAGFKYATKADCTSACGTAFKFSADAGEYPTTGNTLNCREYHLRAAYAPLVNPHCGHLQPDGGPCQ